MLRKIRLFYYNNKQIILISIGIIIFVYIIIRIINYNISVNREKELAEQNSQINESNIVYLPTKANPAISDSEVSEDTLESDTQIIQNFIDYGNSNNIEAAYELLSQDCKDEMFPNIEKFYNNYFKDIFSEKRSYDIKTWISYGNVTYRVKFLNNIMATGKINDEFIEDYFTVINEGNKKKLNINQFIGKNKIEKHISKEGLDISVMNQYIYYDYEQYEIKFTNNSEKNITIDTKNDTETIYLQDKNGVEYTWFGNEIPNEYLRLSPGEERTFRIKFNKLYNTQRRDSSINFEDIREEGIQEAQTLKIQL